MYEEEKSFYTKGTMETKDETAQFGDSFWQFIGSGTILRRIEFL
jgi:hypothetical protein